MLREILIIGLLVAFPLGAMACPSVEVDMAQRDQLHDQLKNANNEMAGRTLNDAIWKLWVTAPDKKSQAMLDLGRQSIRYGDYERAVMVLTELIDYCPNYAEGWNQRAFVRYLKQDNVEALEDIEKTLELEPRHFGALSGRALTLLNMGRTKAGHAALREALKLNPWLSERHLLPPTKEL